MRMYVKHFIFYYYFLKYLSVAFFPFFFFFPTFDFLPLVAVHCFDFSYFLK